MLTIPQIMAKEMIDELKATGKFLDALTLHLFTAPTNLGKDTALGDFVEAVFPGYAAAVLGSWGSDWYDPQGNAGVTAPSVQFTCTGDSDDLVLGCYLTAVVSSVVTLRWGEKFAGGPIAITKAGDAMAVLASFSLPGLATATAILL